jgi:hypothetical protein
MSLSTSSLRCDIDLDSWAVNKTDKLRFRPLTWSETVYHIVHQDIAHTLPVPLLRLGRQPNQETRLLSGKLPGYSCPATFWSSR